jgi:hypothetical protein
MDRTPLVFDRTPLVLPACGVPAPVVPAPVLPALVFPPLVFPACPCAQDGHSRTAGEQSRPQSGQIQHNIYLL